MSRLPNPGSDNGTWGNILNDFLTQIHNTDGSLKDDVVTSASIAPNSVDAASIADGSITEILLDSAVQTKLNAVGGTPDWSTISNKPAVIAAGIDQAAARTAIGAGTASTKTDVGLGNVDNTSDANKNAAIATLTNKTISGASNTITNIAQSSVTNLTSDLASKEPIITAGSTSQYWRGDKTWQTLDKNIVGLGNADNTSDATKNSASVTLTNKTLDTTNIVTLRNDRFILQDSTDASKQLAFQLSGIISGATRTLTVPDASTTLVGTDTTQTLTNKTLTSPKISSIIDANGNTALTLGAISSAVNNVYIDNQPTGGGPTIGSTGSDTNVDLALTTKGTGVLFVIRGNGHSTVQAGGGYNSGNVNLELNSQGTGVVRANGNPVITTSTAIPNVTGTPSSSTYLRGDGTWATISAGSSTFADNVFTLQDNSDATKQAQFELSGITTGTTRTLTVPNASTTLVGTDATQTLTNKTISGASNTLTNIGLASLSATGTASSATYLRGDNTWATPYTTSYTANVGDGTSTSIVITHNLGTRNVVVNLYDATTYQQVNCDIYRTSTNTITLTFAVAPATNAYVCVVANGSLSTTLNSTDITDSTATGRSVLTAASATAARSAISAISATSTDTLSNKTLDNSNVATVKDTNFTLQDDGDATKQLKFQLSGITTATTRTLTVPDASTTLVGIDTTQTLTNKTISATSNTISGITSSGTYASRPSASAVASGSMYFCTDIDTVYVSNGSVWNYLSIAGKSSNGAMGDPKSTGLSNTTLGSATFTADRGTRVLSVPSNGSDVLRGEHWALSPTSNYTATFYLDFQVPNGGYTRHGVYLLESSSSKLIMLTLNNQGSFYISAERWNNFTSPTASFVGQFNLASGVSGSDDSFPHWFRIRDDGTNRYMEISFNGHEWVQILSEARTTFITPDYIGWGGDINNGSITSKVRLRSFYIG